MHRRSVLLVTIVVLFLASLALSQTVPCVPFGDALVGKKVGTSQGCGSKSNFVDVSILTWGLTYTSTDYLSVCGAVITSAYQKSDKQAVLFYRPKQYIPDFKTIEPAMYKRYQEDLKDGSITTSDYKWPCWKIPVETVRIWTSPASTRRFKSLVAEMVTGAEAVRDFDFELKCSAPPGRKYTLNEVEKVKNKTIVASAAITYLTNLAYSNFFCV